MDEIKLKKDIVDKIKASTNVLVTVSNSPSVDALSAALGLTLALNKIEKYATAIFSGDIPPAISFLEPEKTFENTTDGLRDFIIALSRDKADHLRFKPEGDHVKIYITPYKTTITPEDLSFSQGDFNVELVIALGVDNQEHLDAALESHGQILHDATVVTMTVGDQTSTLGGIDWHDAQSSSLSEMTVGLVEALKDDAKAALIDGSIATAFLTGIVAQTDRFSNVHTTSKVMTVAAQLMAAGADQQLVAFKLQETHEISSPIGAPADEPATETSVDSEAGTEITLDNAYGIAPEPVPEAEPAPEEATGAEPTPATETTETPAPEESSDDGPTRAYVAGPSPLSVYAAPEEPVDPNAVQPEGFPGTPAIAPGSMAVNEIPVVTTDGPVPGGVYALQDTPPESAEEPVAEQAPVETPVSTPAPGPADLGLPLPPPLPDFSAGPVAPAPAIPLPPTPAPERLGDILSPEAPAPAPEVSPPADPANPAQFQIPNQPQ